MKKLYLLLAFLLCLTLCGCANAVKTPGDDKLMADVFNAVENEDFDSAKEMLSGFIPEADLDKALPQMSEYISGTVSDYTKIGYYYNFSIRDGEKLNSERLTYNVKTQYDDYIVEMIMLEKAGSRKVFSYNIVRVSEARFGSYIIDFNNFDILQLAMLIFSVACIGLIVYTIVICAKSRIRLKPLWIVVIILLQAGIMLSKTGISQNFRLTVMSFDISKLMKYINGDYVFTLLLPLGAILFLCLRKRLISSAYVYYQKKAALNNAPADTAGQETDNPEKQESLDKETDKENDSVVQDDKDAGK